MERETWDKISTKFTRQLQTEKRKRPRNPNFTQMLRKTKLTNLTHRTNQEHNTAHVIRWFSPQLTRKTIKREIWDTISTKFSRQLQFGLKRNKTKTLKLENRFAQNGLKKKNEGEGRQGGNAYLFGFR